MQMRSYIMTLLLLVIGNPALANTTLKTRKAVKKPSPFSVSVGVTQLVGARINPITQASLSAGYSLADSLKLGLSQSLTRNYLVNREGDEFVINDSSLSLTLAPKGPSEQLSFYSSLGTTLPISERSQRHEIHTVTDLFVGSDYTPWKPFTLGAGLGGSYHFSKYDSEATGELGSGAALPQYRLDVEQSARLRFLKSAFLGYNFTFSETSYYKIQDEAANSNPRDISDQSYQLKVYTGYSFGFLAITLGYSQGTLLELPGLKDYVLFDEERTLGYLAMSTTL